MTDRQLGFEIDGDFYDLPLVGSFDLDENRIFYKATGMHAEDVWLGLQADLSFSELMRNEGFLTALAHIAYRREHEDLSDERIARQIGKVNRLGLFASLVESMADPAEDENPKESGTTNVPNESSTSSNSEKPSTPQNKEKRSGKHSKKSSGRPEDAPETTGTGGPDTSSTSDRLRRVV